MNTRFSSNPQSGSATVIFLVIFSVTTVLFGAGAILAYVNYVDQKTNVDSKVSQAVATAERKQSEKDQADFIQKEKIPYREYVGPSDFGSVSFKYPKTWSVYIAKDGTNGDDFQAYLHPIVVPSITNKDQRYALEVSVDGTPYETTIERYQSLVKKGDLKTSAIKVNGHDGTRLEGLLTNDIRGSVVLFKIRDKTLVLQTDAVTFKSDFDAIIKTLNFNQ